MISLAQRAGWSVRTVALAAGLSITAAGAALAQGGEIGVSGDYTRWTSALPAGAAGGTESDRVTFQSQVALGLGVTAWLQPWLGIRANGWYARSALVRTSDRLFSTDRTGVAIDDDVRLTSGTADLLFRPFGIRSAKVLFIPFSPYLSAGAGMTWVNPRPGERCNEGSSAECGTQFNVDGTPYLLERRLVPSAAAALGLHMPFHPDIGATLEVGDRLMRSPVSFARRSDEGVVAAGRIDRIMHGPYARLGLRLFAGDERPVAAPPPPPVIVEASAAVERGDSVARADSATPAPAAAAASVAVAARPDTIRSLADLGAVVDSTLLVPLTNPPPVALAEAARRMGVAPIAGVVHVDSAVPRAIGNDGFYDVVLDIPNVSVDEIVLEVNNLHAHVSLDAKVAKLVSLNVGADVGIERVYLGIKGVQAEAHLKVDLDNVATIVDRVLTTIDRNPEIISGLLQTLETTVTTVGGVANTALQPGGVVSQAVETVGSVANTALQPGGVVSQAVTTVGDVANTALQPGGVVSQAVETVGDVANTTLQPGGVASQLVGTVGGTLQNVTGSGGLLSAEGVNALGQTLTRTVDGTGQILSRTLDQTGAIVGEQVLGNVLSLPVLSETALPSGQVMRTVRDVTGALIEVTLDAANTVLGTRVLQQAGGVVPGAPLVPPAGGAPLAAASGAVGGAAGVAGAALQGVAQQATKLLLMAMGVNAQGQVVQRVVQPTGTIVSRVIDPISSRVVSSTSEGLIAQLPLVRQATDSAGNLLREVRDASGAVIELTITPAGTLTRMRVIELGDATSIAAPAAMARPEPEPSRNTPPADSAPAMLLAQYTGESGQVVQRFIDATGNISERSLNAAGQLIVRKRAANARRLPIVREVIANNGDFVRLVQDPTGALIELTFGGDGDLSSVRVLQRGSSPASVSVGTVTRAASSLARPVHEPAPRRADGAGTHAVPSPVLALLGQGLNAAGHVVQRVIEANGAIVERSLDASGRVLQHAEVGNLLQLAVLSRVAQADGSTLLVARDVTGTLVEVALGAGGKVTAVRRLDAPPR